MLWVESGGRPLGHMRPWTASHNFEPETSMKRRKKPLMKSRRQGQFNHQDRATSKKFVILSTNHEVNPFVAKQVTQGHREGGYGPMAVAKDAMDRRLADPNNIHLSAKDFSSLVCECVGSDNSSEMRRNSAALLEQFLSSSGNAEQVRKIELIQAARSLVGTCDEEPRGSGMVDEADRTAYLQECFRGQYRAIELANQEARKRGFGARITMVLDPSDPRVWVHFEPWIDATGDTWGLARVKRGEVSPIFVIAPMPTEDAVERLTLVAPEVARTIVMPVPGDGYWAVVMSAGGAEAFPMPELP